MDLDELLSTTREAVIEKACQGLRRVFCCKPRVRKQSTASKVIATKQLRAKVKPKNNSEGGRSGQRNIEIPIGLQVKHEEKTPVKEEEDIQHRAVKQIPANLATIRREIIPEIFEPFATTKREKIEEPFDSEALETLPLANNSGYRMSSSSYLHGEQVKYSKSTARTLFSPKTVDSSPIQAGTLLTSTSSTDARRVPIEPIMPMLGGYLLKQFEEDIIDAAAFGELMKAEEESQATIKLANRRGRCLTFPIFQEDAFPNPGPQELLNRLVGDVTYDEDQSSDNNIVQDGLRKAKAFLIKNVKAIAMQVIRSNAAAKRT